MVPPPTTDLQPVHVFGPDYVEDLELRDGSRVRLRMVRPSDKDKLVEGLQRLSPHSRYLRFFTNKDRLTDRELRYLTEVDGETHFAIGASRLDEDGIEGDGLGIGRFVRLPEEPRVAEPALAVVDGTQGLGLGRLLMLRLIAAATERGIETFRCDFLAINHSMQDLLCDVSSEVEFEADGPVVTAEFPLPSVPPDESLDRAPLVGPLFRWFKLVAEQAVELRRLFEAHEEQLRQRWKALQEQLERRTRGGRE